MKRVFENHKNDREKMRRLIEENESLKSENNLLTGRINNFKKIKEFPNKLKQKVKYYRDKYHDISKMIESMMKEVNQTGILENICAKREVNTSQKCRICEENQKIEESVKEKFESMKEQFKIIKKFSINQATTKKTDNV